MKIDAYARTVNTFEFETLDSQGRLWECQSDFTYDIGNRGSIKVSELTEFKGRFEDGPYKQITPDDKMLAGLAIELIDHEEIIEAEEQAKAEGRDEEVAEPMNHGF